MKYDKVRREEKRREKRRKEEYIRDAEDAWDARLTILTILPSQPF
jgi:hypothetical protein